MIIAELPIEDDRVKLYCDGVMIASITTKAKLEQVSWLPDEWNIGLYDKDDKYMGSLWVDAIRKGD